MELISEHENKVTTHTFTIKLDDGRILVLKEYQEENGKVIDTELQDEEGMPIDFEEAAGLVEEIQAFLELQGK